MTAGFACSRGSSLAVSATSFAAGWKHYVDVQRQHTEAQQATRAQWLNQPAKNPHSAAHYGMYAFKPKSRLSMVDTGIDPYVGRRRVARGAQAERVPLPSGAGSHGDSAVRRADRRRELPGHPSPLHRAGILRRVRGEREQGTLRQLLSLGVSRRDLLAGKALGIAAALALVVVPATLVGVAGLALTAEFGGLREDLPGRRCWRLVYLIYFATFVAISLGLSARAPLLPRGPRRCCSRSGSPTA